jgi:hypothetical protein
MDSMLNEADLSPAKKSDDPRYQQVEQPIPHRPNLASGDVLRRSLACADLAPARWDSCGPWNLEFELQEINADDHLDYNRNR